MIISSKKPCVAVNNTSAAQRSLFLCCDGSLLRIILLGSFVLGLHSAIFRAFSQETSAGGPLAATTPILIVRSADPDYGVVHVDENRAVFAKVTQVRESNNIPTFVTNRYTLLENSLNYLDDNGVWRASEDVIESFPDGAIARRGPHKAIFSHDLNTHVVFDLQSSDGLRLRGNVRSLHLTDRATGKSLLLGVVKPVAPAEIIPPNSILFRDAFEGEVRADLLIVWQHNMIAHDVILRSRPSLPVDFAPETTRFEVATEFVDPPQPAITRTTHRDPGNPDLTDDAQIRFGKLNLITGRAFPLTNGVDIGGDLPHPESIPVAKQWEPLKDGRTFVIESIGWQQLLPHAEKLELAALPGGSSTRRATIASTRQFPQHRFFTSPRKPVQLARAAYQPSGYLIDLEPVINFLDEKVVQSKYIPAIRLGCRRSQSIIRVMSAMKSGHFALRI